MLHRVLLGSLERFIGALIEHYKGALPVWLSPLQVLIIPLNDSVLEYSGQIKAKLAEADIRVEIDSHSETLNKRIRMAEVEKTPYTLVVGDREAKAGAVSVRKHQAGDQGSMALEDFIKKIKEEIDNKVT